MSRCVLFLLYDSDLFICLYYIKMYCLQSKSNAVTSQQSITQQKKKTHTHALKENFFHSFIPCEAYAQYSLCSPDITRSAIPVCSFGLTLFLVCSVCLPYPVHDFKLASCLEFVHLCLGKAGSPATASIFVSITQQIQLSLTL